MRGHQMGDAASTPSRSRGLNVVNVQHHSSCTYSTQQRAKAVSTNRPPPSHQCHHYHHHHHQPPPATRATTYEARHMATPCTSSSLLASSSGPSLPSTGSRHRVHPSDAWQPRVPFQPPPEQPAPHVTACPPVATQSSTLLEQARPEVWPTYHVSMETQPAHTQT